jgi:hypothetical protein
MLLIALAACSGEPKNPNALSKEPLSVRGWIADVETSAPSDRFRTVETENARRAAAFQATNIWVENAAYASGGVAENGAFILLDVPPGNATIGLAPPGLPQLALKLENVPGNADVFIPGMILRPNGIAIADPKAIQVRVAAKIGKPAPAGVLARINGIPVPVMKVPINSMIDRHDYPTPPGNGPAPLATVK